MSKNGWNICQALDEIDATQIWHPINCSPPLLHYLKVNLSFRQHHHLTLSLIRNCHRQFSALYLRGDWGKHAITGCHGRSFLQVTLPGVKLDWCETSMFISSDWIQRRDLLFQSWAPMYGGSDRAYGAYTSSKQSRKSKLINGSCQSVCRVIHDWFSPVFVGNTKEPRNMRLNLTYNRVFKLDWQCLANC